MFFAAGVSAYGAAMFHLFTHAFFKALLFLGAGSEIHAMSDQQDTRRMDGICSGIPFTYAQNGRASCRERVCTYVEISVVAGLSTTNKPHIRKTLSLSSPSRSP